MEHLKLNSQLAAVQTEKQNNRNKDWCAMFFHVSIDLHEFFTKFILACKNDRKFRFLLP